MWDFLSVRPVALAGLAAPRLLPSATASSLLLGPASCQPRPCRPWAWLSSWWMTLATGLSGPPKASGELCQGTVSDGSMVSDRSRASIRLTTSDRSRPSVAASRWCQTAARGPPSSATRRSPGSAPARRHRPPRPPGWPTWSISRSRGDARRLRSLPASARLRSMRPASAWRAFRAFLLPCQPSIRRGGLRTGRRAKVSYSPSDGAGCRLGWVSHLVSHPAESSLSLRQIPVGTPPGSSGTGRWPRAG
jgi:hypothetical protein